MRFRLTFAREAQQAQLDDAYDKITDKIVNPDLFDDKMFATWVWKSLERYMDRTPFFSFFSTDEPCCWATLGDVRRSICQDNFSPISQTQFNSCFLARAEHVELCKMRRPAC